MSGKYPWFEHTFGDVKVAGPRGTYTGPSTLRRVSLPHRTRRTISGPGVVPRVRFGVDLQGRLGCVFLLQEYFGRQWRSLVPRLRRVGSCGWTRSGLKRRWACAPAERLQPKRSAPTDHDTPVILKHPSKVSGGR